MIASPLRSWRLTWWTPACMPPPLGSPSLPLLRHLLSCLGTPGPSQWSAGDSPKDSGLAPRGAVAPRGPRMGHGAKAEGVPGLRPVCPLPSPKRRQVRPRVFWGAPERGRLPADPHVGYHALPSRHAHAHTYAWLGGREKRQARASPCVRSAAPEVLLPRVRQAGNACARHAPADMATEAPWSRAVPGPGRLLLLLLAAAALPLARAQGEEFRPGQWGAAAAGGGAAAVAQGRRYLLYDVNPPEGFNLRRDVYIRMASLLKTLLRTEPWVLVLPPWGRLYHWQSPDIRQVRIPWADFFDLPSLGKNIPVLEYEQFMAESGGPFIEQVYVLQGYAEGWKEGAWEEKVDARPCLDQLLYSRDKHDYYRGWFWGYEETRGLRVSCLSVQGSASVVAPVLLHNTSARSVMLDRAENLLHDHYGGKEYWDTRRSMVFAKHLRAVGDDFRSKYLNSSNAADGIPFTEDWTRMKVKLGASLGGPYLGVHLRRKDFIWGHREDVPSLQGAVKTIRSLMETHKLARVFVATDAVRKEAEELKRLLPEMVRFEPTWEELELYKDGGVAIIDQWICTHARVFIGTSVSTFSFRIHEEREILGLDPKTTYNRFCGDQEQQCEQPTHWKIAY